MPSLAEFQRGFAARLLAQLPDEGAGDAAPAGLRVHRNTAMKGLVDALLANFPTAGVLMGAEWLAGMARGYARQNPPRHAVLADYGDAFPAFLRAMDADHAWPYLPGVAELDRAWMHSLLASDSPALTPGRLAGLAPGALASLQLRLHPAARYGVHAHSAVTVWRANHPPALPHADLCVDGSEESALMLRNLHGVMLLPLDAAGRAFVEAIISGASIAAAAGAAIGAQPDADVASIWSTLLMQGAFADIDTHGV